MSVLFLLASLGVINGALVAGYLYFKRPRTVSEVYFAGLLLALCIRIGKSVIFYFSEEVDLFILQIGLSACIFIGPFFYLYIRSLRQQSQTFGTKDHILLAGLLVAMVVAGLFFPYRSRPDIWNGYIIYGIYSVWVGFTLAGLYQWWQMLGAALKHPRKLSGEQQYLAAMGLAQVFITLTYLTALFGFGTYIWGALIFSFTFYYLAARAILKRPSIPPKASPPALENGPALLATLDGHMAQAKPYLHQGLKLDDLAKQLDLPRHTLSRLLNEEYKLGFAHYLKVYRVQEAQQLIRTRPELSLEGIGYEAGFRSKSTFYEAFKKVAHCTPAEYKNAAVESPKVLQNGSE